MHFILEFHRLLSSDYSLPSSLEFLDDSNEGFEIGLESDVIIEHLDFLRHFQVVDYLLYHSVSLSFSIVRVFGQRNCQSLGGQFHLG